jgi:hypothetical protein
VRYRDEEWLFYRYEFLYYALISPRPNSQSQLAFVSHLFEARYFRQDKLVQLPLFALLKEAGLTDHPYLNQATRELLIQIAPAVFYGWAVLEEVPIDDDFNQQELGFSRSALETAVSICFRELQRLSGVARFAALLYRPNRLEGEVLTWLREARSYAEQVLVETDPEFSSDLFIRLGDTLYDYQAWLTDKSQAANR